MLKLYIKTGCPFCNRVLDFVEESQINVELHNVYESQEAMDELMEKGGKRQIPFLHDTDKEVMMYESADIIQYLKDLSGNESKQEGEASGVCIPE